MLSFCKSVVGNIDLEFQQIYEQFGRVLDGAWCNSRRNVLTENNPEKISNIQKTNPKNCK